MSEWTEAMVERLKELYPQSLSATEISHRLSTEFRREFSRNAVIGKLKRLGLSQKKRGAAPGQATKPRTRNTSEVLVKAAPPSRFNPFVMAGAAPGELVPAPDPNAPKRWNCEALPESRPVPIADLGPLSAMQCRWPLAPVDGVMMFCGGPAAVRTSEYCYCRTHWEWRVGISSPRKNADEKDAA